MTGSARTFALISGNGQIQNIEIYSYQLRKGEKIIHNYHIAFDSLERDLFFSDFSKFVDQKIRKMPIEQNILNPKKDKTYRTLCLLEF